MEVFSGDAPMLTSPFSRQLTALPLTMTERISNESPGRPGDVGCARISHAMKPRITSNRRISRIDPRKHFGWRGQSIIRRVRHAERLLKGCKVSSPRFRGYSSLVYAGYSRSLIIFHIETVLMKTWIPL